MRLDRLPLESSRPVITFAAVRLGLLVVALVLAGVLDLPSGSQLVALLAGVALPWAAVIALLARHSARATLHPLLPLGDIAVLALVEAVVPETYAVVRFLALFFVAAHAHLQGDLRGVGLAAVTAGVLIPLAALGDPPVEGDLLVLYESLFALCLLAAALTLGGLRAAESAGRLRARELSRRAIETEDELRRRVAESIHDGPVQELVGLDLMLSSASSAAERNAPARAAEILEEARDVAERSVRALRDGIVDLGPHSFDGLSFEAGIEGCAPVWERRYGLKIRREIEPLDLPHPLGEGLFRIAQEAVSNAGRHAGASAVSVSLRRTAGRVELRVFDDGEGFGPVDPLGPQEVGHIGLARMRERAELLDGELEITTGAEGTEVAVRVPLPRG